MNTQQIDTLLKKNEEEIKRICSPFNGNCFEIAYSLNQIFGAKVCNFCCVYAETNFINDSKILPLHITTDINGVLFDAGGRISKEQLLTEFAPKNDKDLIITESEFLYHKIISKEITNKVIKIYQNNMDEKL